MNISLATTPVPPALLLQELEQVESIMRALSQCAATLEGRRSALTAKLELATRPAPPLLQEQPKTFHRGFEYRGEMSRYWYCIEIHVNLLRRLWTDFPEVREEMARAMGRCGTNRKYVARTPGDLFTGKTTMWAERHSEQLVDGWHVDTNLNLERMRRTLPAAAAAAGLKWGKDIIVHWRRR